MDQQQILICQKHKKKQKKISQIPANYYICLNRYCPNAYSILCSLCKQQHRDHQVKVLTIQDIAFLVDRLLKLPFKQVGTFINQSIQILKKVKLVSQFTGKIGEIINQLQIQVLDYTATTQRIVAQYAQCKNATQQISYSMNQIETKETFEQFRKNKIQKLNKIDYNIQKDRLQYGNLDIKQKQDGRKKLLTYVRRKIEEIKQYSMKIIQVILNNDQSDDQQQDIALKKKNYQTLKSQIKFLKKLKINQQLQHIQTSSRLKTQPISSMSMLSVPQHRSIQKKQQSSNTDNKWMSQLQKQIKQLEKNIKSLENQLQSSQFQLKKTQSQYKLKLLTLQRQFENTKKQRQFFRREKQRLQKAYEQKMEFFTHYQHRLRDNHQKRTARYKQRQQVIKELIELIQHHRVGTRGGTSVQKENRLHSRSKKKV